jgi:hypothetical protein
MVPDVITATVMQANQFRREGIWRSQIYLKLLREKLRQIFNDMA